MMVDGINNSEISSNKNISNNSIINYLYNNESVNSGKPAAAATVGSSNSIDMSNTVYTNPKKDENRTVADQLEADSMVDSQNKRNGMIVVSNTTSSKDYQKISEDGFSFSDMSEKEIITETDKIKAVLAKAGVDISIYGDSLSKEQLEEITGNVVIAASLAKQLQSHDIPVNEENLKDGISAVENGTKINKIDENTAVYLVENNLPPSIENVYKASYSSNDDYIRDILSDEEFDSMRFQIKDLLANSGIDVNDDVMQDCKFLIEKGVALTEDNIKYFEDLISFNEKDIEYFSKAAAESIAEGNRPMNAMIIEGYSMHDIAWKAQNIISNAEPEDIIKLEEQNIPVTIRNLEYIQKFEIDKSENINYSDFNIISAKRKLEEARLAMTADANLTLLKRGIAIDTKPIEQIVDMLKQQETKFYSSLMEQHQIVPTEQNIEMYTNTINVFEEMKSAPAYVIDSNSGNEVVLDLANSAAALKSKMDSANESYETLMTAPRADMGDSIQKAFRNVDDILHDLGLDKIEANQRAVRILGYNNIEISIENINKVKAADEEVQRAFKNMTPAVTLEMIRKGISPLELTISELNEVAVEIKSQSKEKDEQKFSEFLWKLEKNNEITQEERSSYIGIYRLISQVEKSDGAVIGALLNEKADITMKNLLSAVRTSNKKNIDYKVDNDFNGVESKVKGPRIDDQINASYNQNCINDIMDEISPQKLMNIFSMDWENMTPEQFKQAIIETKESQELADEYAKTQLDEFKNAVQSEEAVYQLLDRYDVKTNMVNLMAAARILKNPGKMVEDLWENGDIEMVKELKNQVIERFGEAIKKPDEMADAQEQLAETATHVMDSMIIEDKNITSINLKELKILKAQFSIASDMAKSESYVVPIETSEGGVTGINLKIVHGKKEKGYVDIFFNDKLSGKVAASFEAKKDKVTGIIAVSDVETQKLLADKLNNFTESLYSDDYENIDIRIVRMPELSGEKYISKLFNKGDKASSEDENMMQTKRLYHIAETFIDGISSIFGQGNL